MQRAKNKTLCLGKVARFGWKGVGGYVVVIVFGCRGRHFAVR